MRQVKCDYCNSATRLAKGSEIYAHRPDLKHLNFWVCDKCDAYVGCHKNGSGDRPLGRLANAALRKHKSNAHAAFDPLWKEEGMSRGAAYGWLAKQLKIDEAACHIGMFNEIQCMAVVRVCMIRSIKAGKC